MAAKHLGSLVEARNVIVSFFLVQAYNLHQLIFGQIYSYPVDISFNKRKISWKVDNVFQAKYVPFIVATTIITGFIGMGSSVFLLVLKLVQPSSNISMIVIFNCIFLVACGCLEIGTYTVHLRAPEIEAHVNQMFSFERMCKFKK